MEIWGIFFKNCVKKIWNFIIIAYNSQNGPMYANEYMHCIYDFSQPCLTLLRSCVIVIYDNYNTTRINEAFINNFFATTNYNIIIIHYYLDLRLIVNIIIY